MSDGKSGMEAFETMMAAVVEGRTCVCVFAVAGATCKPGDVLSGAIILGLATAGDFAVLPRRTASRTEKIQRPRTALTRHQRATSPQNLRRRNKKGHQRELVTFRRIFPVASRRARQRDRDRNPESRCAKTANTSYHTLARSQVAPQENTENTMVAAMIDRATDAPRALADAIGGVPGERLLGHVCELIESSAPARGRITGSVIRQGGRRDDVPETERD